MSIGSESIVYIDFVDSNSKNRIESWDSELTEYQEMHTPRPLGVDFGREKQDERPPDGILEAENPLDH
jgi:hypothetical protein